MALISMRQLLDHAAEFGYGVPAFNVNNLEQTRAIMEAADATNSPVIMQASAGARKYAGAPFLRHLIQAAIEEFPHIPVVMHQDHGVSPAVCQRSIQLGFSSVMMDGSLGTDGKTPMDYDYNVDVTRRVVDMAHACGVSVEGELGCLGSLETGEAGEEDGVGAAGKLSHEQMLTDPEEAAAFVAATGVDALAIACGTSHGAYKFSRPPTGDILAIDRIKEINARIPNTHLVMHGSSSVPQEWLAIINEFGGNIPETYGVPLEQIQEGIRHGVRKVNIDTDLRLASTGAVRRFLAEHPAEFDPRKFLAVTTTAMKDICVARYEAFGTSGHADKIKVRSLIAMQEAYDAGQLGS
ncbi:MULTISPECIES: class II fructose-bisphosphate aldolase [Haliea]|jgi:fructose-bisphosphate aldolase class II|uniref:class II fructose-bisphosphate aldolase n=1 Tax=Haliea TaxID=475794 RepID=UPI00041DCB97|nr:MULTISPECIES: class II fructose-bisphosphate aldolase [Haliea]HBM83838.1 fructose-bisphosphate aldolase class II [Halieaceae bacterium]MAD64102.1 fructose-bisphosphate aldolase class II [Haliea sp.]MAY92508.1 fructose-bisphosphate aldolase class II [Haliea sp.]MBK40864.1 fructose-bisphosphate aldolase class II [Haliea sp.]MBP68561.1 fructose-bisphosphate aldolase class II [Haliea sp.]